MGGLLHSTLSQFSKTPKDGQKQSAFQSVKTTKNTIQKYRLSALETLSSEPSRSVACDLKQLKAIEITKGLITAKSEIMKPSENRTPLIPTRKPPPTRIAISDNNTDEVFKRLARLAAGPSSRHHCKLLQNKRILRAAKAAT